MPDKGFTHLHLHSQYSLLDGAVTFEGLFERCKKLGMNAVAVTDHGNMFGAVEFYTKAKAAEIKPIIGIEAYIAPGSRFDRTKTSISDAAYHLILLAENNAGYRTCSSWPAPVTSTGSTIGRESTRKSSPSAMKGSSARPPASRARSRPPRPAGDMKAARQAAESYLKIFGPERFFIELQSHQGDEPDAARA